MSDYTPKLTVSPYTAQDAYEEGAVRAIQAVKKSFQEDLDRLLATITMGMPGERAAVDAAWIIKGIIRGLEEAVDRVLGHSIKDEENDA